MKPTGRTRIRVSMDRDSAQGPMMVDTRWIGPHGIGRFAREVIRRLDGAVSLPLATDRLSPFDPIRVYRALRKSSARSFFSPGFNPPLGRPCPFVFTIHDLIH